MTSSPSPEPAGSKEGQAWEAEEIEDGYVISRPLVGAPFGRYILKLATKTRDVALGHAAFLNALESALSARDARIAALQIERDSLELLAIERYEWKREKEFWEQQAIKAGDDLVARDARIGELEAAPIAIADVLKIIGDLHNVLYTASIHCGVREMQGISRGHDALREISNRLERLMPREQPASTEGEA